MQIFERWGLHPQTPVPPAPWGKPDPHWPPVAGGSDPRPPKQPLHCEFILNLGIRNQHIASRNQHIFQVIMMS